jgi:hypothetical protein
VTEEKWLAATNPLHLLMYVRRTKPGLRSAPNRRKARLFACACVRNLGPAIITAADRAVIEVAEGFAEGKVTKEQLEATRRSIWATEAIPRSSSLRLMLGAICYAEIWNAVKAWRDASHKCWEPIRKITSAEEKRIQASLVREIFGNPFRPVAFDPKWGTSTAVALARGIYQDRAFDRLPILADALQDAGCETTDILDHCRGPGPHVRGCWVVDLLLA